jgi:Asp-tRNA(Asn)/Glu-tRNA(Gln) amidotransferase A subunit family amidase
MGKALDRATLSVEFAHCHTHYHRRMAAKNFGKSGAKMIWGGEAVAVRHDGRANPNIFITPTTPGPPITIEEASNMPIPPPPGEVWLSNTRPFNAYGLPTISIPCGFTSAGLPIGLQIAGPRFGEGRVLAFANAFEEKTDWHKRAPALPHLR